MSSAMRKSQATLIPMKPKITVDWEWITKAQALIYMDRNFDRNRRLRRSWIMILVQSMQENHFQPTHQGIAFDEDDNLIDGQHRLTAIIESDISTWLLVARRVPRDAVLAIDLHTRRTPSDQIIMIDESIRPNSADVAIARCMAAGPNFGRGNEVRELATTTQVHHFLLEHWKAIRFSQQYSAAKRICAGPVRAAIARAYYHVDRERLVEYMKVLHTMLAESPKDHAAVNFRKFLEDPHNDHLTKGGGDSRVKLYRFAVASIQAFLRGLVGKRIEPIEPKDDPWPLPEES